MFRDKDHKGRHARCSVRDRDGLTGNILIIGREWYWYKNDGIYKPTGTGYSTYIGCNVGTYIGIALAVIGVYSIGYVLYNIIS